MITPQSNERRVLIPVRWSGGEWKVLDDSSMPKLAVGTVGELSVPASAFLNPKDTKPFLDEFFVEILPATTMLWASISSNHGGSSMNELVRKGLPAKRSHENGYIMVGFLINEPLVLRLRGTKHASLEPCPCDLPDFPQDIAVGSINQAYTRLSEKRRAQCGLAGFGWDIALSSSLSSIRSHIYLGRSQNPGGKRGLGSNMDQNTSGFIGDNQSMNGMIDRDFILQPYDPKHGLDEALIQATAQTNPVIAPSFSVNSFLPEAVIISLSLARVMPT